MVLLERRSIANSDIVAGPLVRPSQTARASRVVVLTVEGGAAVPGFDFATS
jgi:hypothetical protein